MKQRIVITESDLHRMIKESVQEVINEAYSDAQYANLAGQAYGATNSLGGKIKGMFNPQWKKRKERQMKKFADQATGGVYSSQYAQNKNSENNGGDKRANYAGYSGKGPTYDYVSNKFNKDNKETPFEYRRSSYHYDKDAPFDKAFTKLNHDGEVLTSQDVLDKRNEFLKNNNLDKNQEWTDVKDTHSMLNRAFNDGKNSVKNKGKIQKTSGGNTYTYGTGTQSDTFKKWK